MLELGSWDRSDIKGRRSYDIGLRVIKSLDRLSMEAQNWRRRTLFSKSSA